MPRGMRSPYSCTGDQVTKTLFSSAVVKGGSAVPRTSNTTIPAETPFQTNNRIVEQWSKRHTSPPSTPTTILPSALTTCPKQRSPSQSHHQPTLTPTLRLRTNTMPLKPPQRMISMIPMSTTRAKAQKRAHNLFHHHLRRNNLFLPNAPARIRRSKPESTNGTAWHVSSALRTHSSCVRL
jgi:hypothetical protein